jgi:hypothetical protein
MIERKTPPHDTDVAVDQDDIIAFLADPATYGPSREEVERIETHGAIVFLAGDRVHKLKKAVQFPYMDFSTLERRRAACLREIEINRPQAPQVYIDAAPVTREPDGTFAIGGRGEPVDWVVRMNRFDQAGLFDRLADEDRLDAPLLTALTDEIRRFHARAEVDGDADGVSWIRPIVAELTEALASAPDIFGAEAGERFSQAAMAELDRSGHCLRLRARRNCVRRCHGDLHLRNIVLIDGRPVLFDAIEFDEALATIDTLYDLAFLIMDLSQRGMGPQANLVLNRYLHLSDSAIDLYGLAAMPLFLACRAGVRAMVAMNRARQADGAAVEAAADEARHYCAHALGMLARRKPRLIAVGGLSGTGKTTLAAALAPGIGAAPGAVHLRSDLERKIMFGAAETERLGSEAYTPQASARVYDVLRQKARIVLVAGSGVIVDAVFSTAEERRDIEAAARSAEADFTGLWLNADQATMVARVEGRRGDASDATADVVRDQIARGTGPVGWTCIDAGGSPADTLAAARSALDQASEADR